MSYSLNDRAVRLTAADGSAADHRDTALAPGATATKAGTVASCNGAAPDIAPLASPTPAVAALLPPDADPSLIREFICEGREQLQHAEVALLALERAPDDAEAVNTVFRAFHTIKGTAAFLALDATAECAHHAESILSRVRDREIRCTGGYADLALRALDMIRTLLDAMQDAVEGRVGPFPPTYHALLSELCNPEAAGISETQGPERPPVSSADTPGGAVERSGMGRRHPTPQESAGESTVRVRTDALERLSDLVDELVLAGTAIVHDPAVRRGYDGALPQKAATVARLARELQALSFAMRTVPLTASFQKVARLVRDLGSRNGKRIAFITDGDATEIDRSMVHLLGDPLVHMARNAVDHGIESSTERRAAGKPEHGTVYLSAHHDGGNVVVELRDDGRGLDRQRIVEHALERSLISTDEGLTDADAYRLIFTPGFSTAETITDVSGRGVGMDVVRQNIEALHGRVDIHTQAGQGTTFRVTLPQTLAITNGTLVGVGASRPAVAGTALRSAGGQGVILDVDAPIASAS